MSNAEGAPDVTLVLEWDNVRTGGDAMAEASLAGLAREIDSLDVPIEVFVMHDPPRSEISAEHLVATSPLGQVSHATIELIDASGLDYYELKNAGGRKARGDIIVMADCDSVPEPGWLQAIVDTFDDPDVDAVAGATYTNLEGGIVNAHFALNWQFEPRPDDGPVRPTDRFKANNIAFRRSVFAQHEFPYDDRYRGRCRTLAKLLIKEGFTVVHNPCARMAHAQPRGPQTFVRRAMMRGHDQTLNDRAVGRRHLVVQATRRLVASMRRSTRRAFALRDRIDLPRRRVPAVLAVGALWELCSWLGSALTIVAPRFVRRVAAL